MFLDICGAEVSQVTAHRSLHDVWGYELSWVRKNINISNCLGSKVLNMSVWSTECDKNISVCSRETLEPNACNINKWDRQQKQSELDYNLDQIFYHLSLLKNQNMDTQWYTARSSFYFCFFSVFLTFLVVFFWSFLISCLMILFLCKNSKKLLLIRWKLQQFKTIIPQIQFWAFRFCPFQ